MSGALLILAIVSVSDVAAAAKFNSDRDPAKKPTVKVQDTNSAFELFDSGRYLAALDRAKELAAQFKTLEYMGREQTIEGAVETLKEVERNFAQAIEELEPYAQSA